MYTYLELRTKMAGVKLEKLFRKIKSEILDNV